MKKICILTSYYLPKIGGTETLTRRVLESLNDSYEVDLVTFKNEERNLFDYPYKIYEMNPEEFQKAEYFFKVKKYDLIIFFSDLHSPYVNLFNPSWTNKYMVVLNLDEITYGWKDRFPNATKVLKQSKMVVTFSKNGIANKFLQENNIKNTYIPNFSKDALIENIKNVGYIKSKTGLDPNKKTIGYMASYEMRKNQLYVLERIAESDRLKNYNFLFMGGQPEPRYIQECVNLKKKYDLKNVFFVKGTSDQDKINMFLNEIDALLLCSIAEGLPLCILEAMSAGKPWVSTPVGGIRGVFSDTKAGIVLPSVNVSHNEIADGLEACLQLSPEDCRNEWRNNFNSDLSFKLYKNLVEELTK